MLVEKDLPSTGPQSSWAGWEGFRGARQTVYADQATLGAQNPGVLL